MKKSKKTFEIRVTQELKGFYEGILSVKAKSALEALKIANKMKLEDIDEQVEWSQGDEYWGDYTTIEIHKDSI